MTIRRGDILEVDLPRIGGSIQYGKRTCIVVSNNMANIHSPIITVVPCTTKKKNRIPTHFDFIRETGNVNTALCEQIMPVQKTDVKFNKGHLNYEIMEQLDKCLRIAINV